MLVGIRALTGALFLKDLAAKVRRGMNARAKEGRVLAGSPMATSSSLDALESGRSTRSVPQSWSAFIWSTSAVRVPALLPCD